MCDELPKAVWEGSFRIFGVDIQCVLLDDGRRIVTAESLERLFAAMEDGIETMTPEDEKALLDFNSWQMGLDTK